MMMPLVSFAGGYLTNTNQHAAFLRSLSRGAAIDIDGALSNPAGLSFLPTDGFRVGVSIQSAFQTRDIDASFGTYNGFDPVNKVPHKIAHIVQYIFFPIVNNQLSIVNKKGIFAPEKECLLFRVLAKPRTKNKKDMKHKKEAALVCFSGGQDSTTCLFRVTLRERTNVSRQSG